MLSTNEFKKILGNEAQTMTVEEVELLKNSMYQFAGIAFDFWIKKSMAKKPKKAYNTTYEHE